MDPGLRLSASVSRVAANVLRDDDESDDRDGRAAAGRDREDAGTTVAPGVVAVGESGHDVDPGDAVLPGEAGRPGGGDGGDGGGRGAGGAGRRPVPLNWRRTLYALWVAQILALVAFSMRAPFLPFYLADLGLTDPDAQVWWAVWITASGSLCMAIAAPIWGIVSDRVGRKPMVIRAMLFASFTIGLMAVATAPWHLVALRLVEGAFTGTVTACAALVAATVPRDRVGFGLGLIQTSVFSGGSLGPLFGGFLAEQIGYRWTCGVAAGFMVVGLLIVVVLVEERFQPVRRAKNAAAGAGRRFGGLAILAIPIVLTMVLVMLVTRGTSMALQPILPLYVATLPTSGFSVDEMAGLILGAQGLTSALASVYFGRLGDRHGHRPILTACCIGAGFIYLPMAIVTQAWQLLVLQALFGVVAGGLTPAANALVAHATDPAHRGVVFGLMAGAGSLGAFVVPLLIASLATNAGYGPAFVAIGIALLLMSAAVVYTFSHRAREAPLPDTPAGA